MTVSAGKSADGTGGSLSMSSGESDSNGEGGAVSLSAGTSASTTGGTLTVNSGASTAAAGGGINHYFWKW